MPISIAAGSRGRHTPAWPIVAILFAAILSLASVTANASQELDLGTAGDFNAFMFEGFDGQYSDVEGRLASGGTVSVNGYGIADKLNAATAGDSVVIDGDLMFPQGKIYYGNALVSGSTAGVGQPVHDGMAPACFRSLLRGR